MSTRYSRHCAREGCRRRTKHSSGFCYSHQALVASQTPKGLQVFHSGGPLGASARAVQEKNPIPPDSANVPGYPYLTTRDVQAYQYWKHSGDVRYRPPASVIMQRFPVEVLEVPGSEVSSEHIAIYDARGDLHVLARDEDGSVVSPKEGFVGSEGTVVFLELEDGQTFALHTNEQYLVVRVNDALIPS